MGHFESTHSDEIKACWPAVFSLFMGVASLIAAEFIPVSLLTPIAKELAITEGLAGQSVTMVGIFAFITSLLLAPLTKSIDRRLILLAFSFLLVLSNEIVAFAPSYPIMLLGRALLGICVGGFWSMASAVTLLLVPAKNVPKALSIVYAGVSVATIISLPLASYAGHLIGWRNVFHFGALMGGAAFLWQFLTLPSLPARSGNNFHNMFRLLGQGWVLTGIGGIILSYGGYHVFFTYLRPFLEHDLTLPTETFSSVLLVFGLANCLGTFVAGAILGKIFRAILISIHLVLAALALAFLFSQGLVNINIALAIGWGFIFGFIPVGWSTWIARTLAGKAEIAGGLSVAAIQFSIGLAAAIGGWAFDFSGIKAIFVIAAILLLLSAFFVKTSFALFQKETGRSA